VLPGEHGTDQPQDGRPVGEDATTSVRADLPVETLLGLLGQI